MARRRGIGAKCGGGKGGPPLTIRLAELRRLFRFRLGDEAPKSEIEARVGALGEMMTWDADRLGMTIELLFAEKRTLRIRTIRCCDASKQDVAEAYRIDRQRRQNHRRRERRREAARQRPRNLSTRAEAIAAILTRKWTAVRDLAARVETLPPFLLEETGELMDPASLKRAIRRAIDALVEAGVAEELMKLRELPAEARQVRLRDPERSQGEISDMRPSDCPQLVHGQDHGRVTGKHHAEDGERADETCDPGTDTETAAARNGARTKKRPHRISTSAAISLSASAEDHTQSGARLQASAPRDDDDLEIPEFLRRHQSAPT